MNTKKILMLTSKYLPEEEYQKAYKALTIETEYNFICSMYNEGLIIYIMSYFRLSRDESTKRDFPNLYKLTQLAKKYGYSYFDLFQEGERLEYKYEHEFELKFYDW